MGANLHIRWLLPIAAAGMSSRDLQVTRWEYMCVCNVCRSVTGPLLLWGLSHISFGLLLLIHKCPNSAQHRGSHAKVAAECTDYGQWPKSGAGIQPSQMSISGLGNFFFFYSKCLNICIFRLIRQFLFFSLLNQDLHSELSLTLLLNHHHLKISTDEILFASPKHLHCNGEGGIKSKPFSQQWPGGGTPSAWHSCLLGGSWEKVVLSF